MKDSKEIELHSIRNNLTSLFGMIHLLSEECNDLKETASLLSNALNKFQESQDLNFILEHLFQIESELTSKIYNIYKKNRENKKIKKSIRILLKSKRMFHKAIYEIKNKGKFFKFNKIIVQNEIKKFIKTLNFLSLNSKICFDELNSDVNVKHLFFKFKSDFYYLPVEFMASLRDIVFNARKYSEVGDYIVVSLGDANAEYIDINVFNTGMGIPEKEIDSVSNRGYRASNVRHIRSFGGGFGLTKARIFCKNYGGRLEITSSENLFCNVNMKVKNKKKQ